MVALKTTLSKICLVMCLTIGALSVSAQASEIVVFENAAVEPYQLMVGDKVNWGVSLPYAAGESAAGFVSLEKEADSDAMMATWNGKGEAQVYLVSPEPVDLTELAQQDGALVMLLKVNKKPKKQVTLRMGCGFPCAANADISKLLKALPEDQWLRLSVALKCFVDGGLNTKTVDTPLLLLNRGKLSLSIADVRLVPQAGSAATIKC